MLKKIRTVLLASFLVVFIQILMIGSLIATSVTFITSGNAISPPSDEIRDAYHQASIRWTQQIQWKNPRRGQMETGLSPELLEQVKKLRVDLSPGLLLALSELGGEYDPEEAKELAEILQPTNLEVIALTERVEVSSDEGKKSASERSVLRIAKIETYNGTYTYSYRDRVRITKQGSTTTTTTTPELAKVDWKKEDTRLIQAMQEVGLNGDLDRKVLYKQALALDRTFNDPNALTFLAEIRLAGGGIGFTGVSSGPYSLQTVITEDSGVTTEQIERVLQGTPMAGLGQAFLDAGVQYGIDPAFLVGIAGAEQGFDPPPWNNAFGITGVGDAGSYYYDPTGAEFAAYSSVEVSIYAAARLLSGPLYVGAGKVTIYDIWNTWAPGQADNDPNGLNANWAKNVLSYMGKVKSSSP